MGSKGIKCKMNVKGQIKAVSKDWQSNRPLITLEVSEGEIEGINDLLETDLAITFKKYRQKRSLNANAYMWELLGEMARVLNTSQRELYDGFILDMRLPMLDEDGERILISIPSDKTSQIEKLNSHWCFYSQDGTNATFYMLRGSSDFDSKEMSDLIDKVVYEAKALGIETLTPDEIARLEGYEIDHNG